MIEELKKYKSHLQYLRDEKNQAYGVVLAFLDPAKNVVNFGWSKVGYDEKKKVYKDSFNKDRAQKVAFHRAASCGLRKVPVDFKRILDSFMADCKDYFTPKVPVFLDTVEFKEPLVKA